jgi:predicted dehydrogenase
MIGIGVIGYGYWGPNLVRNFMQAPGARVVAVSDLRADRLALVNKHYPSVMTTNSFREVILHPDVDAVLIATPVTTHYELAELALKSGKHVLVEKPLATTSGEGAHLIDEALRRNRVLMVDHTFVYTGAVRKCHELASNKALGDIYYYDSVRVNLGLFQHDVNVIWDLAVHDLAIMDYVLPLRAQAVSATGMSHVPGKPENIAYLTLFFNSNLIAHIHVNWLAPVKIRRTLIGGSQRMVVYDDLEPSEKIKIYDKGITVSNGPETLYRMLIDYRTGDMWAPQIELTEALQTEARHFIECIETGLQPITDAVAGLRVVEILEAASESMNARGQLVKLNPGRLAA